MTSRGREEMLTGVHPGSRDDFKRRLGWSCSRRPISYAISCRSPLERPRESGFKGLRRCGTGHRNYSLQSLEVPGYQTRTSNTCFDLPRDESRRRSSLSIIKNQDHRLWETDREGFAIKHQLQTMLR